MPTSQTLLSSGCSGGTGFITITSVPAIDAGGTYDYLIVGDLGQSEAAYFLLADLPLTVSGLADDGYTVTITSGGEPDVQRVTIACSGGGGSTPLTLVSVAHTNETAANANNGTATITASGGVAPLTASITGPTTRPDQATTSGSPTTFTNLAPGTYTLRVTDTVPASVQSNVVVAAYTAPVYGCTDEYASNYNPLATASTNTCAYASPLIRAAWQPMEVAVSAVPGQQMAFIEADLFIGFRPGHPLAAGRPYGAPLRLRATVGPQGIAVFRLGPFLRTQLGAPDGVGGYRLDLNSPTAFTSDCFVGYELRRTTGELVQHGYALNSALPDNRLLGTLTPCSLYGSPVPLWTGYLDYLIPSLTTTGSLQQYGIMDTRQALDFGSTLVLPCPAHPLPVRWLSPEGGYGFWVFAGKHALGDEVEDGQAYNEALTGERRYSERGTARQTIAANSGSFPSAEMMQMLRTLLRSPQVWYQPTPESDWLPATLESGSFPAGRVGVRRQELTITLTHAAPEWVQGQ